MGLGGSEVRKLIRTENKIKNNVKIGLHKLEKDLWLEVYSDIFLGKYEE